MTWGSPSIPEVVTGFTTLPSSGIKIFSRRAGPLLGPILLLLHGFPSSSFQYRYFIPLLASHGYNVIAPDFPGFGFTEVPPSLNYTYSFANIAGTISEFLDVEHIDTYSSYIFDYGAPVGLRIALQRPQTVQALITQNGNAYVEGFGQEFWKPVFALWNATTDAELEAAREFVLDNVLTFDGLRSQYTVGVPDVDALAPEPWTLDYALMQRCGNKEIQLGLYEDYQNNVKLYPQFQKWIRDSGVPVLATWGKNDIAFIPPGAEAFRRDAKSLEIKFVDTGHFALESNLDQIAGYVLQFLRNLGIHGVKAGGHGVREDQ